MSIEINDKWRINWTSIEWNLENKKIVETGKHAGEEKWVAEGHYANPDQLQLAYASEKFRSEDIQTLEDMQKVAVSVREEILRLRGALDRQGGLLTKAEKYIDDLVQLNPGLDTPESEDKYRGEGQ